MQLCSNYNCIGCSESFQVSTRYFACAYSQRGIYVDQIYSYEYLKIDPQVWWSTVPANFDAKLHFHNVPITGELDHKDNPLTALEAIVEPKDFVAFKLDVDTTNIELPIALAILRDPKFTRLVDEFFFELHYNCPILGPEWKARGPDFDGLKLNLDGAFNYFTQVREAGIRAHFWP